MFVQVNMIFNPSCFFFQCVLTDQRIKAIEQVHGYFSSEQVQLQIISEAQSSIYFPGGLRHFPA